jgi:hypothetical protein
VKKSTAMRLRACARMNSRPVGPERVRTGPRCTFGQSKKNASTGSFPWASAIFGAQYVNTSCTIISNGIIKAWECADCRQTRAHDRFDSPPTASGRITELLRTRGMSGGSAKQRDITGTCVGHSDTILRAELQSAAERCSLRQRGICVTVHFRRPAEGRLSPRSAE